MHLFVFADDFFPLFIKKNMYKPHGKLTANLVLGNRIFSGWNCDRTWTVSHVARVDATACDWENHFWENDENFICKKGSYIFYLL